MLKKVFLALLFLVAAYFAYDVAEGYVVDWYSDTYIPRPTEFPASAMPDEICLTWPGDTQATMAIQWRTATEIEDGWVQYRKAADTAAVLEERAADRVEIVDSLVENDPANARFSVSLEGLEPGTSYDYRVGSKSADAWSDYFRFTTAPANDESFSFVYWGDVQRGYDYWGQLMEKAEETHPQTSFHVIAGDLVNNGDYRDQWDAFFANANDVFARKPLLPILGNHDYDRKKVPQKYLDLFTLGENGPDGTEPESAYSLTFSNTLFVALDSNRELEAQTPWLEEQLAQSDATWKIVLYHHPAYVSAPHRANDYIRDVWCDLFEEYGVDLALQGHDHAYLRTYPMRDGEIAPDGERAPIYIVSVAGNKYYEQEQHPYTDVGFEKISTYQVIDVSLAPDRLQYRAYDLEGQLKDELLLSKEG